MGSPGFRMGRMAFGAQGVTGPHLPAAPDVLGPFACPLLETQFPPPCPDVKSCRLWFSYVLRSWARRAGQERPREVSIASSYEERIFTGQPRAFIQVAERSFLV